MHSRSIPIVVPLALLALVALPAGGARADPILPVGHSPDLDAQMTRHARQFYTISARPFGLSLDVHAKDAAAQETIATFLAQDESDDFAAVTGVHPFELISQYGEFGDLGFFGGIAVAATAYEYRTLKRDGAPADVLARARARVVRAAESWHVFYVVTGGGGVVARGIRRGPAEIPPEAPGTPDVPTDTRELVPLADENGDPLPQPKNNGTYRADNSGGVLPEGVWIWSDSCSKDQLVGQIFAMVALYDAIKDDPDIDQSLVTRMQEDARLVGEMLMVKRDLTGLEGIAANGFYDLVIMDADGRPTYHHDLNPASLEKVYLPPGAPTYNLFNLVMGWGVFKGLHHVTGDERIEAFLYEELLGVRDYLGKLERWDEPAAFDYIYAGTMTNFDNPDMTSIALWLALYHETDADVRAVLHAFLEEGWWNRAGESHTARLCKQPLWHAVYLGLTDRGTDPALVDELVDLLLGFELGPYWNPVRINCDEAEIEARSCLAIDGETVIELEAPDDNGRWQAKEALHPSIRPPSNFDARSNPFSVNGGGGLRLNPGGDLLASYWLTRYHQAHAPGEINVSPNARDHVPVGGDPPGEDAGADIGAPDVAQPDVGGGDVAGGDVGAPDTATGADTAAAADTAPSLDTVTDTGAVTDTVTVADTGGVADTAGGSGELGGGGGCASAPHPVSPTAPLPLPLLLALALLALALRRRRAR